MSRKDELLIDNAVNLSRALLEVTDALTNYYQAVKRDGTDSLEAVDWLNVITRNEMCIQQFTNRVADIEGDDSEPSEEEGDDAQAAPLGWDSIDGGAWPADDWALNSPARKGE